MFKYLVTYKPMQIYEQTSFKCPGVQFKGSKNSLLCLLWVTLGVQYCKLGRSYPLCFWKGPYLAKASLVRSLSDLTLQESCQTGQNLKSSQCCRSTFKRKLVNVQSLPLLPGIKTSTAITLEMLQIFLIQLITARNHPTLELPTLVDQADSRRNIKHRSTTDQEAVKHLAAGWVLLIRLIGPT